jgi:hypothetical protein
MDENQRRGSVPPGSHHVPTGISNSTTPKGLTDDIYICFCQSDLIYIYVRVCEIKLGYNVKMLVCMLLLLHSTFAWKYGV